MTRAIRNRRGMSLVELLIVLVVLALVLTLVSTAVLQHLDKARGVAATADARAVLIAGQAVLIEAFAYENAMTDRELAEGLSGAVDSILYPEQTRMSRRMNELLSGLVLGNEPGGGAAVAAFTVEGYQVKRLVYTAERGGRVYRVTVVPNEEAVIERVR